MSPIRSWVGIVLGLVVGAGCHHRVPPPPPLAPVPDNTCDTGLSAKVREHLAVAYSCNLNGYRCLDGHNGRAFVKDGYLDGNMFYTTGVPSASIQINVFATASCAADRLDDLVFTTHTVKNPDSRTTGEKKQEAAKTDEKKADAKGAVDDTKKDVDVAAKNVSKKVENLKTSAGMGILSTSGSLSGDSLEDQLVKLKDGGPRASDAKVDDTLATVKDETKRLRDRLHELDQQLGDIKSWSPEIAGKVRAEIANAMSAASRQDWEALRKELDDLKATIDNAKPEAPKADSIKVEDQEIVVRDYVAPVPDGDDNSFFTISVSRISKTGDGKESTIKPWPTATLSVKIDHGRYSFEGGFLFAGVYHGERFLNHKDGMDVTACPDACRWATQGLLAGTFFFYRHKLTAFDRTTLIPGIQAGINADVTKFADAWSLGAIWEPITGVGFSAGFMRYSRASSPYPNSDGSFQQEKVWLPYVGLTINSDILDTMKGLASSKDKAGNAEKKD